MSQNNAQNNNQNNNTIIKFLGFIVGTATILISYFSLFNDKVNGVSWIILILAGICLLIPANQTFTGIWRVFTNLIALTCILLCIAINLKVPKDEANKIPSDIELETLEINLKQQYLKYSDSQGNKQLKGEITETLEIESIRFESYTYDAILDNYKLEGNKLFFYDIPAGDCSIDVKFENYDAISDKVKLYKKDLSDKKWTRELVLQPEGDYKNFNIKIVDKEYRPLTNKQCNIAVSGLTEQIENIVTGNNGEIPYDFTCNADKQLNVIYHADGSDYEKSFNVKDISSTVQICFEEALSEETMAILQYDEERKNIEKKAADAKQDEMKNNPRFLLDNSDIVSLNIQNKGYVVQSYSDALGEDAWEKQYTFSLAKPEPVWVEFLHDNLTEDSTAWRISISDSDNYVYMEFDSKMNKSKTTSPFVGLKEGTYYVNVRGYSTYCDAKFQMNVLAAKVNNYEREVNNEVLLAHSISNFKDNKILTRYGNLAFYDDVDYYELNLKEPGILAIKFEHENYTDDANGWKIMVKNSDSEVINEMYSNWQNLCTVSPNIGLPAGKYYIQVEASSYYNDGLYALSMVWHKSDYWEMEFNDYVANATDIIPEYTQYGSLLYYDDVDYYKLTCQKSGTYKLSFEHDNFTEDSYAWKILALDENSNSLWEENLYSRLNDIEVSQILDLNEGNIYYFCIESYNNYSNNDYEIKLTYQE